MAWQLEQPFEILYGHPIPIHIQPYKAKKNMIKVPNLT
jgi:hypothetical protein